MGHHATRALLTSSLVLAILITISLNGQSDSGPPADESPVTAIKKMGGTVRPFVKNHPGLEVDFHLQGRNVTDQGLAHVAALRNVVSLDLRDTKITSAGLVHLKRLKQLRRLHLERTNVDDEGIKHLSGLVNLEYLNVYGTKITDKALLHLTQLKKLKTLYVWQTKVTKPGTAKLQSTLPKLRIVRGVDLAKLPSKEIRKPSKKPVPIKWNVASGEKPPKSKLGSNITVIFENKRKQPVKLFWISYGNQLKLYATLAPGSTRRQNSYSEATWLITDEQETPLGYFITISAEENLAVIPIKS